MIKMFKKLKKRMRKKKMSKKGQMAVTQGTTSEKMSRIKKIGVLRMAGFMGLYGVFIGLISAIVAFIFSAVLQTMIPITLLTSGLLSYASGALMFLFYPLFFGGVSFVGALIFTPLMNLILKIIGGVSLKIE